MIVLSDMARWGLRCYWWDYKKNENNPKLNSTILSRKMRSTFRISLFHTKVARSLCAQFSYSAIQFPVDDTASLFFPVFQIPQNGYHLYNLPLQILPTLDHDNGCVMKRYIFAHVEIVRYSFKLTGSSR